MIICILLCGCQNNSTKKEHTEQESKVEEIVEKEPEYHDDNNTPISFYQLKGNKLEKIKNITGNYQTLDDILFLQIFPSSEEVINLNKSFSQSFYDTWITFQEKPLKIGFSIKITLMNNEVIDYLILNPNQTMDHWEYLMSYIYDDYINQGKSFYSHIESNEYTENTLFTAFKLQCGDKCHEISSPLILTVFTYDGEDDFLDGTYRGNSQYTIPICIHGNC